jgi:hypothetical protein
VLERGDHEGFERMFRQVADFLGPLTTQGLKQPSFLIDRLVERC